MGEPLDLTLDPIPRLLASCAFPDPPRAVTCAVSGGADSLALLVLAVAAGCEATAVHVDHGLRPDSATEAEVVADVAARLGAGFRGERVVVEHGPNLEARARAARYGVLPAEVLTGHTADDRAETVLLNMLRGAGPAGAAGIRPSGRHPLLALRRADTHALCRALALDPVADPSNVDPRFRRNRVRHELLPLLATIAERDVVPVLVRQADLYAELDGLLAELAAEVDVTDAAALTAVHPAVGRMAVRGWLLSAGVGEGHPVDAACVERVLGVARGEAVATEVAGGRRVARSSGRLTILPPGTWQDARHG